MCNGNLGMYRVMPWAYPTIQGQSTGGVSVDPTPEPTPEPQYYDFSGVSIEFDYNTTKIQNAGIEGNMAVPDARFFANVSGVNTINDSEVSRISMEVVENNLTVSPTTDNGVTLDPSKNTVRSSFSGKNFNGIYVISVFFYYYPEQRVPFYGTSTITLSGTLKLKLKAYNSNGDLLQESQEITVTA